MLQHDKLFIGGDWVAPAGTGTIEVISPHTEEIVGRVPDGTPAASSTRPARPSTTGRGPV